MRIWALRALGPSLLFATVSCGGKDEKPAQTPAPTASESASAAPVESSAPAPSAAAAPPAAKGRFYSFALSPTSGKVDKIGNKDGALAGDGVKDLVFDAEIEGPAIAFIVVSVDGTGLQDGAFSADTYTGTQKPPSEASVEMKPGKFTGGVGVFEDDKLVNAKDGSIAALSGAKHKLALHISSKEAPKGAYRAIVIFDDQSVVPAPTTAVVK